MEPTVDMYAARPSALELRGIGGSPTDEPDRDERPAEMHPIVKVSASPRHPIVKVSASPRRSLEGRPVAYAGGASLGSTLSCMTNSTDSNTDGTALLERAVELEKAGLAGSRPLAIWCGNIPETSNSEAAIRVLFSRFGEIRRVYVRRKSNPSRSWCLMTYRSSTSVDAALAASVVVKDADGADVELAIELPEIKKELSKPKPGALSSVVAMVLDDYKQNPSPRGAEDNTLVATPETGDDSPTLANAKRQQRRHSVVELEIRNSLAEVDTTEACSALKPDQAKTRSMWNRLRSPAFRNKLAVTALFVQNDDQNEKAAKRAIKHALEDVRQEEDAITKNLKGFAQLHNGELCGLDYRFKTEASLFRKVMARLDRATAEAAISKTPPPAAPELLATILDILRYTVVFPTHRYTSSVREMIHALKQHQYKQHRVKNYWGPGDGYQGINAVFVAPSGQAFELQFHTPESLSMKEEECHSSYAKFCAAKDSRKMMQYWEEMISMWDLVPVPEDVLEIPQVVQQKLEFDLSRLSEEETAAIQHRKSLEHVCRYHVDELHARAVKAEAEIRALMVYLMHKHAPGGTCKQKEKRRAVRAQLSMLRQLVDSFVQSDQSELDEPDTVIDTDSNKQADSTSSPVPDFDDPLRRSTSAHRHRAATMSDQSFGKVGVGVKLSHPQRVPSIDIKTASTADGTSNGHTMVQSVDKTVPDEGTVRDRLRELESEFPPLKYQIVCSNEQLYSTIVNGFLRDIASDSDYEVYAVNNWWDDLEKFGAVNARFLAGRHGLRFEVTFHTDASWDASIEHSEYMRRKFDTVIKTDVLFTDNPQMVTQVKSQMRREEMWRERWSRITVPDRALTIGTLRYAHIRAPDAELLNSEAQKAVGRSHRTLNRLDRTENLVRASVRPVASDSHGNVSTATQGQNTAVEADEYGSRNDPVGGAWTEMVGAFFEHHRDIAKLFDEFKAAYVSDRDPNCATWQPLASRFAALEQQMARIQAMAGGDCAPAASMKAQVWPDHALVSAERSINVQATDARLSTVQKTEAAVAEQQGANAFHRIDTGDDAPPSACSRIAPLPMGLTEGEDRSQVDTAAATQLGFDVTTNGVSTERPLSEMIEKLLRNQETIARLAGRD